jgi:transcription elongation factor Elf1
VSENVKPCPFCGHVGISLAEGTTYRWRVAECSECGARCGEIRVQTSGAGTRQEWEAVGVVNAIEEWNKRTEPADLAEARRDAERYRWLREAQNDDIGVVQGFGTVDVGGTGVADTYERVLYRANLDAAIDAARKETP